MKIKNINGFTLVELLAVIVILSLLALLAATSITKLLKDTKEDLSNIQISSIKSAAETWGSKNMNRLPKEGECKYITLNDLKDSGLLDSKIVDSNSGKELDGELKIKITSRMSKFNTLVTDYEVNPKTIQDCKHITEDYDNIDMNGNKYKYTDEKYYDITTDGEISLNSWYYDKNDSSSSGQTLYYAFKNGYENLSEINIPPTVNGIKVTSIASSSRVEGAATTVRVPEGVKKIGMLGLGTMAYEVKSTGNHCGEVINELYLPSTLIDISTSLPASIYVFDGDTVYINMKQSQAPSIFTDNKYWNNKILANVTASNPTVVYLPE